MGTRNSTLDRRKRRRDAIAGKRKQDSRARTVETIAATSDRDELQRFASHGNYHVKHAALYKLRDEQYLAAYGVIRGLRALA